MPHVSGAPVVTRALAAAGAAAGQGIISRHSRVLNVLNEPNAKRETRRFAYSVCSTPSLSVSLPPSLPPSLYSTDIYVYTYTCRYVYRVLVD